MPMRIMDLVAVNYDHSIKGNKPTHFHPRVIQSSTVLWLTFVLRLSQPFPFHPLPSSLAAHTRGRKTRLCSLMSLDLRLLCDLASGRHPTRYLQILSVVTSLLVEHTARILLAWMLAEAVVVLLWVQRFPFLISRQRQQHPQGAYSAVLFWESLPEAKSGAISSGL